jgi:spermidine/putrescine transport system substrate-binding protein
VIEEADMATRKQGVTPTASLDSKATRRRFLGAATAAGVASWSGLTIFSRTAHAAGRMRVLCWPGYEEKPVIEEFEQKNDCKVEFKTYIGGEQMLQFFAQSPKGTFDAIISDAEYVQKLTAQKALDPLKPADFPNLADYHPKYRDFAPLRAPDSKIWAVPTRFSFYGLSYNTKYMTEEEAKTWNTLFLPKYKGKVALFDWYLPNMSNASLAVKPNNQTPYDISDAELAKVKEWLFKLRPQISVFSEQNQGLVNALINEDAWVTPTGDMEITLIGAGHKNFASTVPDEGSIRWSEAAALCADSKNKELALKWIEYMSGARVQSELVYTKGFKARAPNMKVTKFWNEEQTKLMSYVPDPKNPGKMLVETLIDKSVPRGLPVKQPDKAWIAIYNEFKTSKG